MTKRNPILSDDLVSFGRHHIRMGTFFNASHFVPQSTLYRKVTIYFADDQDEQSIIFAPQRVLCT